MGSKAFAIAVVLRLVTARDVAAGGRGCPSHGGGVVTIGVIGDSNTRDAWPSPATRCWATRLAARMKALSYSHRAVPTAFVNVALGATVASGDSPRNGVVMNGPQQLTSVLERGDVDLVIIALGTNDLYYARVPGSALYGRSPVDAWRAVDGLIASARSVGVPALVATIPPRYDDPKLVPDIAGLNRLVSENVPEAGVIDFTTHFGRHLFLPDGLHLNAHGQEKRARRAATVLLRVLRDCNPRSR